MRLYTIFLILTALFFLTSCQDKNPNDTQENSNTSLENKYKDLEEYQWLSDENNFQDEDYQKKFNQHFEQNLKENNWEAAAAYLIAYGDVLDYKFEHDSLYLKKTEVFLNENKNNISDEARGRLYYYVGNHYFRTLDLEKSNDWLKKCIEIVPQNNSHKNTQGFAHFAIAQNYMRMGKLELAEQYVVKALNIFEEVEDLTNQGTAYLLMFSIYTENNAYEESEKFLKKAIDIFEKTKNDYLKFMAQSSYIHFHIDQGDTLTTLNQIDKLAEFSKKISLNEYQNGLLNQYKAFKYTAQKKEDSALYYLKTAKEIAKRTADPDLDMRNFFQEILFSKAFDKPLENIKQAEDFFEELAVDKQENRQFMAQIADVLFKFYLKKGEHEKANYYAVFLIDDAYKQAEARAKGSLFELERKFETERKEKTILLQEKKLADQNKMILYLVILTLFIILISVIVFVWNKNRNITKEKKITENYASQLLQKTENERKRIASDLHDSVSNELINLRHAIEKNDFRNKIDFILDEVRNISRNISPTLFDKIGLKSSVEQLIERTQNQHNFFITSEINYDGSLDIDKELQLYRIIQEAITNILKHADAMAGKISIEENKKTINVEIRDNGKGFDVQKMLEKGNSFGLLNISERVKYLNGTINFHSDHSGTIIKITLPK